MVLPEVTCEEIASLQSDLPQMDGWTSRFCTFWQQQPEGGDKACPALTIIQGWSCEDAQAVLGRLHEPDARSIQGAVDVRLDMMERARSVADPASGDGNANVPGIEHELFRRALRRKPSSSSPSCPIGQFRSPTHLVEGTRGNVIARKIKLHARHSTNLLSAASLLSKLPPSGPCR
jgi:hypothetical protein